MNNKDMISTVDKVILLMKTNKVILEDILKDLEEFNKAIEDILDKEE